MEKIVIVKYNGGNSRSVANALEYLGYSGVLSDNIEEIQSANKVIFPGQGAATTAMEYLKEKGLDRVLTNLTQPFLGICLGLQLLCQHTEEGNIDGLGVFDAVVKKFPPKKAVPHMGWNNFTQCTNTLFNGIEPTNDCYFVHSYYATICEETIAETDYIVPFSAALQKDNFYAVQFHPEKSHKVGMTILKNFLNL